MVIVLLCTQQELTRERRGLASALARIADVRWLPHRLPTVQQVLERVPDAQLLIAPDVHGGYLPRGIESAPCPTVLLHIDSFSGARQRAETSQLFDLSVVFHPRSVQEIGAGGRNAVLLVSHAIDAGEHAPRDAQDKRPVDVAFVGTLDAPDYAQRAAALRRLAATSPGLALRNGLGYEEMLALYGNAKIGVNVSRDDYPPDANLRCFEVMGSGALLLTGAPSELEAFGFRDGVDYVACSGAEDMATKAVHFLARPDERISIAARGQRRVLAEHTYEVSARRLLAAIDKDLIARARTRAASPPACSADLHARYCIARGYCSEALALLARAPRRQWMSVRRARTMARLMKAVCGRLATGQEVH